MSAMLAKELRVETEGPGLGRFETLNGQKLSISGRCTIEYLTRDTMGKERGGKDSFLVWGIHGYDLVLGMPWPEKWNLSVDFAAKGVPDPNHARSGAAGGCPAMPGLRTRGDSAQSDNAPVMPGRPPRPDPKPEGLPDRRPPVRT